MGTDIQTDGLAARRVLEAWGLEVTGLEHISSGHINLTYRVETPQGDYALQRVNPIFDPAIHHDIQAVTARLEAAGMMTPRLVPAGREPWHTDEQGGVWRLMTWMDGDVLLRADSPERCREAGSLLGRFHRCLWELDHRFQTGRPGVHDTKAHLLKLQAVLKSRRAHLAYDQVAPLADAILKEAELLRLPADLMPRVVHGDPKISNFVFDTLGRAQCLIDLDTLSRMPIPVELGDAFRSWCSPEGEEAESPFQISFFKAGLAGWLSEIGDLPFEEELEAIAPTVEVIALELASRFCADALEESYFRWDKDRYPSASAHNLARTRSQLALARSVRSQLDNMRRIVEDLRSD